MEVSRGNHFYGISVDDEALEILFSRTSVKEILNLRKVCDVWFRITDRLSFWKQVFLKNSVNWETVPAHIKMNPDRCVLLFLMAINNPLGKNFVGNSSGEEGLSRWTFTGEGIRVQTELTVNEKFFFIARPNCSMTQLIDLNDHGITHKLLKALIPVEIKFSSMVRVAPGCNGASVQLMSTLVLIDDGGENLSQKTLIVKQTEAQGSKAIVVKIPVFNSDNICRKVVITNEVLSSEREDEGEQEDEGDEILQLAKMSVRIKCLGPEEAENYDSEAE